MTAVNLAVDGLGFCFVPDFLARKERYFSGNLLYFRFSESDVVWYNVTFCRKDACLSKHSSAFINLVKEFYATPG